MEGEAYNPALNQPSKSPEVFAALIPELEREVQQGDMQSAYALAVVLVAGLALRSMEELEAQREDLLVRASELWTKCALSDNWGAVDNLMTEGVGPSAELARRLWSEVHRDRRDLVQFDNDAQMPIYGSDFAREVHRRWLLKWPEVSQ
ncbi:hypothetical protein K2D_31900 [Planctomycetes bacterium K2D]|uniref:Uncharacterized protein n=2 Tax=Botrimarina mediterranea TaxID=2528022 RepID=A0A518KAW1_9BACT|nr:hypothetical protein Spa11_31390 [Botrimarina mediterranea]QDV79575.1 hypothetical protein K2D_31900 [Planctomycetes bacterium K2D]